MKRCTEKLAGTGRCRLHLGHDGQHQYMSSRDYRRWRQEQQTTVGGDGFPRIFPKPSVARDFEKLFQQPDQRCPGCDAEITFNVSTNGRSVDLLHPQPPCDEFRAFVERLIKRARAAGPS